MKPERKVKMERKDWLDKGQKYIEEGEFERAIKYFDQIIQSNQDSNGWVHYLKGTSLMELGFHEQAFEYIMHALKLDPEGDVYRFDLGRALEKLGRHGEARVAFQQVARGSHVYGID